MEYKSTMRALTLFCLLSFSVIVNGSSCASNINGIDPKVEFPRDGVKERIKQFEALSKQTNTKSTQTKFNSDVLNQSNSKPSKLAERLGNVSSPINTSESKKVSSSTTSAEYSLNNSPQSHGAETNGGVPMRRSQSTNINQWQLTNVFSSEDSDTDSISKSTNDLLDEADGQFTSSKENPTSEANFLDNSDEQSSGMSDLNNSGDQSSGEAKFDEMRQEARERANEIMTELDNFDSPVGRGNSQCSKQSINTSQASEDEAPCDKILQGTPPQSSPEPTSEDESSEERETAL